MPTARVLNRLAILPDVSPTTVEAVLGGMVREGRIVKLGTGRATKYLAYAQKGHRIWYNNHKCT